MLGVQTFRVFVYIERFLLWRGAGFFSTPHALASSAAASLMPIPLASETKFEEIAAPAYI